MLWLSFPLKQEDKVKYLDKYQLINSEDVSLLKAYLTWNFVISSEEIKAWTVDGIKQSTIHDIAEDLVGNSKIAYAYSTINDVINYYRLCCDMSSAASTKDEYAELVRAELSDRDYVYDNLRNSINQLLDPIVNISYYNQRTGKKVTSFEELTHAQLVSLLDELNSGYIGTPVFEYRLLKLINDIKKYFNIII